MIPGGITVCRRPERQLVPLYVGLHEGQHLGLVVDHGDVSSRRRQAKPDHTAPGAELEDLRTTPTLPTVPLFKYLEQNEGCVP